MQKLRWTCLALALVLSAGSAQAQGVTFIKTSGTFIAVDVSADGSTVLGYNQSSSRTRLYHIPTGTYSDVGTPGELFGSSGGVSRTGLQVVGNTRGIGVDRTASRYDGAQWAVLGGLGGSQPGKVSDARGLSDDGSVVVGEGWVSSSTGRGFRWDTMKGQMEVLLPLDTLVQNRSCAEAVSADGSIVVGWSHSGFGAAREATIWPAGPNSATRIPGLSSGTIGSCLAVNADGSIIVGYAGNGSQAFRYSASGIEYLPKLPGSLHSMALDVSEDGDVVVGASGVLFHSPFKPIHAFRWTPQEGTQHLGDWLTARGVQLQGANLTHAYACSGDGRVIVGRWGPEGTSMGGGFIAIISAPTTASVYCTGKVNSLGCTPRIGSAGVPNASGRGGPFLVTCDQVRNHKIGLLFYGFAPNAIPFQGGTLCVGVPKRGTAQSSGGNALPADCSGSYGVAFGDQITSGTDPNLTAGTSVYAQFWMRDPGAAVAPTALSNGLTFTILP